MRDYTKQNKNVWVGNMCVPAEDEEKYRERAKQKNKLLSSKEIPVPVIREMSADRLERTPNNATKKTPYEWRLPFSERLLSKRMELGLLDQLNAISVPILTRPYGFCTFSNATTLLSLDSIKDAVDKINKINAHYTLEGYTFEPKEK